ncbi:phage distal tail protein [Kitasatospora sp. NPDC048239]|uniref:phage distal tail protein n=1 Tax=Kitasatospora sp. NPDC048239 TaxID=3364046 RepID=UPI00372411FC
MAGYVPGQVLGRTVTLGTLQLGRVDAAGVAWTVAKDGLRGWAGAAVRTQYTERQGAHGVWAGPTYLGARVITLAGTITAPSLAALDAAAEQLYAAASLTDTTLTVAETIPKQATVRCSGEPLVDYETDRVARYSVMLTAADPRRYALYEQGGNTKLPSGSGGVTLPITLPLTIAAGSSSGTVTLQNQGTIATSPRFVVGGPLPGFTILVQYSDSTVRQLTYTDTVGAADVLIIDTGARTVVLNGTVSRRRYLSGQWPDIPPGQTVTVQWVSAGSDPSALLWAYARSAWK